MSRKAKPAAAVAASLIYPLPRTWKLYGSQPQPVITRSKRHARRLARKYKRLGIRPSLYISDGAGDWVRADLKTGERS